MFMTPMTHRPSLAFSDLFRDFDRMERTLFDNTPASLATDILDLGDAYRLDIELPGFKKEEINLSYEKEVLTVWAERKPAEPSDERKYLRAERAYKVKRAFVVKGIDEDKITAKYENGLLTINLPLKEKLETSKRVYID